MRGICVRAWAQCLYWWTLEQWGWLGLELEEHGDKAWDWHADSGCWTSRRFNDASSLCVSRVMAAGVQGRGDVLSAVQPPVEHGLPLPRVRQPPRPGHFAGAERRLQPVGPLRAAPPGADVSRRDRRGGTAGRQGVRGDLYRWTVCHPHRGGPGFSLLPPGLPLAAFPLGIELLNKWVMKREKSKQT